MKMQESQLPKGWKFEKVGNITKICLGLTYTPTYIDEGVPFLSVKDISQGNINFENTRFISREEFEKSPEGSKPKKGDVLFGRVGTIGCPQILNEDIEICIFVSLGFFRVNKEILFNQYIAYWMKSNLFSDQVDLNVQGSTLKNLNTGWLKEFVIPLPPLPEQQRIVSILDEAFAAIAKAKANAEQNLKNAKELFDCYLQEAFERKERDWIEISLADVCEISSKLIDPKMAEYQNILHIGAGNIVSKKGTLIDLKTAKEENLISGKFLFDERMVLYSKIRPYLMKVVNCNFSGLCSADIYPLLPFENKLIKDYLYHLLLSKDFTEYAIVGSQRAGMPKVNREHLFSYTFYLPPMKKQEIIVSKLNELSAETHKLERIYQQKLQNLEELRKSILQKAFNGEL